MLPEAFRAAGSPSFHDFLARQAPDLLPGAAANRHGDMAAIAPHGTTIVAATFSGGVVMAGDRRATMGNVIAQRDIEKVFPADEFSCIGIAGNAGLAIELVRIFQVELEHYEKIEGITLSAVGSGSVFARGSLKKLYSTDLSERECITATVQALYDAADDDSATGGPDLTRRIFPIVAVVTADGYRRIAEDEVGQIADEVIGGRMIRPNGPSASVNQ